MAGLFGLVHGLAFSATLSALDFTGARLALGLFGFNLGVEIMQLRGCGPRTSTAGHPGQHQGLPFPARRSGHAHRARCDRLGARPDGDKHPAGAAADSLGPASAWLRAALWLGAILARVHPALWRSEGPRGPGDSGDVRSAHDVIAGAEPRSTAGTGTLREAGRYGSSVVGWAPSDLRRSDRQHRAALAHHPSPDRIRVGHPAHLPQDGRHPHLRVGRLGREPRAGSDTPRARSRRSHIAKPAVAGAADLSSVLQLLGEDP